MQSSFARPRQEPQMLLGYVPNSQFVLFVLLAVFESLGILTSKLTFIHGSSYQLTKEYILTTTDCARL